MKKEAISSLKQDIKSKQKSQDKAYQQVVQFQMGRNQHQNQDNCLKKIEKREKLINTTSPKTKQR